MTTSGLLAFSAGPSEVCIGLKDGSIFIKFLVQRKRPWAPAGYLKILIT
jgi:hypothetical protein